MFDAYGGSAFPGVGDILYNINEQVFFLNIGIYIVNICSGAWHFRIQSSGQGATAQIKILRTKITFLKTKVLRKHVSDLMILIGRASQHLNLLASL